MEGLNAPPTPLPFIMPMDATDVLAAYFEHGYGMRFEFGAEVSALEMFRPEAFLPLIVDLAEGYCATLLGTSLAPVFEPDRNALFGSRVLIPKPRSAEIAVLIATASELIQPEEGKVYDFMPLYKHMLTPPEQRGDFEQIG